VDSRWTPPGLHLKFHFVHNFTQSPPGVHLESIWILPGLHLDSTWRLSRDRVTKVGALSLLASSALSPLPSSSSSPSVVRGRSGWLALSVHEGRGLWAGFRCEGLSWVWGGSPIRCSQSSALPPPGCVSLDVRSRSRSSRAVQMGFRQLGPTRGHGGRSRPRRHPCPRHCPCPSLVPKPTSVSLLQAREVAAARRGIETL